ncbi:hypothetical protein KBG31_02280 [Patescibacteria group bacterium]|nr:hypothetical protein [Patescibacteria group bacterium]
MNNKNNTLKSENPLDKSQLAQDLEKKANFWKTAFVILLLLFIGATGVSIFFYRESFLEKPLVQRQPQVSEKSTPKPTEEILCETLTQEELVSLLPQEATMYELRHNGYNSSRCFYSINVFFPSDMNKKIERDITKNQLVGCWIINLKTKEAKRIANWPDDYSFSRWVSEKEIELMGDDSDTASVFNIETGEVVSRRVNRLNLRFTRGQDRAVLFKPVKQVEGCTLEKEMVQNWVQYPFDCVEKSDVTIQVDGYPELLLKYVDRETVQINGRIFGDLLGEGSWKIEL